MSIVTSVWYPQVLQGSETVTGILRLAEDGELNGAEAVSADDGRLSGPWTAISLDTGTVSISAPTSGFTWEIMLFIASSEAVTAGTAPAFINAETTATNYWNQQMVGSNAASAPNEANNSNIVSYAGSTGLGGGHCLTRLLMPGFRDVYQKLMLVTAQAFTRAAGDAVTGSRIGYRTGASSGAVNDPITTWGYTLPNAGTHAAGSYGFHRWISA